MEASLDIREYCSDCPYMDLHMTSPEAIFGDGKLVYRSDVKIYCCHEELCEWLSNKIRKEVSEDGTKTK